MQTRETRSVSVCVPSRREAVRREQARRDNFTQKIKNQNTANHRLAVFFLVLQSFFQQNQLHSVDAVEYAGHDADLGIA